MRGVTGIVREETRDDCKQRTLLHRPLTNNSMAVIFGSENCATFLKAPVGTTKVQECPFLWHAMTRKSLQQQRLHEHFYIVWFEEIHLLGSQKILWLLGGESGGRSLKDVIHVEFIRDLQHLKFFDCGRNA